MDRRKAIGVIGTAGGLLIGSTRLGFAKPPRPVFDEAVLADKFSTLAKGQLRTIAREPILIQAIIGQNRTTHTYSASVIARLDGDWRREVYTTERRTLIPSVMDTPASHYLATLRDVSNGLYTEFTVTDAIGLNVALSDLTPDYWQGDEEMFLTPFGGGPNGTYLGPDEHFRGIWQRQIAITITAPGAITPIGVLCAGVNTALI